MTIVHIITALGVGGAENLLVNVANRQVLQHELHILYLKKIDDVAVQLNKKIHLSNIQLSVRTVQTIRNYCTKVNADIVHSHLSHADVLSMLAMSRIKARYFCTLHNIYFKKNFIDDLLFAVYRYLLLKRVPTGRVIAISKAVQEHAIQVLRIPKNRVSLVPNAIQKNVENLEKTNTTGIELLFVGRLEKQKSVDTLLRAIHILKSYNLDVSWSLTLVGDGTKRSHLEKTARELQITDLVHFMGRQTDVNHYFSKAQILILPSIWEGFGLVILEAFRAKIAVIASNIEGPSELIKDRHNGLLFEAKNATELAAKIKLLVENSALRQQIAENGYRSFTEEYDIENYVKKLELIYTHDK